MACALGAEFEKEKLKVTSKEKSPAMHLGKRSRKMERHSNIPRLRSALKCHSG